MPSRSIKMYHIPRSSGAMVNGKTWWPIHHLPSACHIDILLSGFLLGTCGIDGFGSAVARLPRIDKSWVILGVGCFDFEKMAFLDFFDIYWMNFYIDSQYLVRFNQYLVKIHQYRSIFHQYLVESHNRKPAWQTNENPWTPNLMRQTCSWFSCRT